MKAPVNGGSAEVPALAVCDLSVSFGGVAALTGVSFTVGVGDVTAIVGPNGAGKSTTLNAVCGLLRATGEVYVHRERAHGRTPPQVAALGVGRSFQDPPLVARQTVLTNLLAGAHLRLEYRLIDQLMRRRKVSSAEGEYAERASHLLGLVGLSGAEHENVDGLPFGARKLVDVVRAMMARPRLLLLDEPSSGLDAQERQSLQDVIGVLNREAGVSIVAVEHHMDLVKAVASHVVVLHAGSVLAAGAPHVVLDSDLVREAFVGSAVGTTGSPGPTPKAGVLHG